MAGSAGYKQFIRRGVVFSDVLQVIVFDTGDADAGKDEFCAFRTGFLGRDLSDPEYSASFFSQRCVLGKGSTMSFFLGFWCVFRPHFRCFSVTFGIRGVPLRPGGRPWARGGVRGHIFYDFVMRLGGPFGAILGPFLLLFCVFFCIAPGAAPRPPFYDFGLHLGVILEPFSMLFGDLWI